MPNMSLKKNPMPHQDPHVRARNFFEVATGYTEEAWNNIEIPEELKDAEGLTLASAQKIEDDVEHIRSGS